MTYRNEWFRILFLLAVCLLSASCAPIYMPTSPQTPMLQEKGDLKAEINSSTSGLELKAAYAVSDIYVVTAMISAGSGDAEDDEIDNSYHRYLEAGFGHSYRPVHYFVIENIGGLAMGQGRGEGRLTIGESTTHFMAEGAYVKPYLQNNLAIQTDPFDFGLVNRISIIQFGNIRNIRDDEETITDPSTPLFWEPTLFGQIGWNRVKVAARFGYSLPIAGEPDFQWLWFHFGFGMNYRFGN